MNDLVVVNTYFHKHEAEIAKGLLESNGITATISADDMGGLREHITIGMGNIRLLVVKNDFDKAKEILEGVTDVSKETDSQGKSREVLKLEYTISSYKKVKYIFGSFIVVSILFTIYFRQYFGAILCGVIFAIVWSLALILERSKYLAAKKCLERKKQQ